MAAETPRTLVLVGARTTPDIGPEIAAGLRPRLDYRTLAEALGADLLGAEAAGSPPPWQRKLEETLATDAGLASAAWRRRGLYDAWLSTSETMGLPLALHRWAARDRPAPVHVMIAHNLASARKRQLHRLTGVLRWGFASIICLSGTQEAFLRDEIGLPATRVHRLTHNVDTEFYQPGIPGITQSGGDYMLAVGRENRDYPALIAAARQTGLPLILVASSLWAARGGAVADDALPPHVTVRREFVAYPALRDLYAGARLVVVPLHECTYAAGTSGLLEALAMGRPTVVSRTQGMADYLTDPAAYRAVPPGDPGALAAAVRDLWDDASTRQAMAQAARAHAETMRLELYVAQVADIIRKAVAGRSPANGAGK